MTVALLRRETSALRALVPCLTVIESTGFSPIRDTGVPSAESILRLDTP